MLLTEEKEGPYWKRGDSTATLISDVHAVCCPFASDIIFTLEFDVDHLWTD